MTHEDAGHYAAKHPEESINSAIAAKLQEKISEGRISCGDAHAAARELQVSPREIGVTIDLLEAQIVQCQLGLFEAKPQGTVDNPSSDDIVSVQKAVNPALVNGRLPCSAAWEIAGQCKIAKKKLRAICDVLNIKISSCQLRAFK